MIPVIYVVLSMRTFTIFSFECPGALLSYKMRLNCFEYFKFMKTFCQKFFYVIKII